MSVTFIRFTEKGDITPPAREKEESRRSRMWERAGLTAVYVIALTMMLLQLRSIL
ncbi:MAG: hypothetical protein K2L35_05745 [Muribaculaceae bacterium]|nr:hypothetical protein [Muribaculaceae bacterium]MDE5958045.1 hypothetical protein [Muribaculaceae bacterium]MDE6447803.1 hypothetical protein [Muribaculaceae bacterium]